MPPPACCCCWCCCWGLEGPDDEAPAAAGDERRSEPGTAEGAHETEVAPIGCAGVTKASVEPSSGVGIDPKGEEEGEKGVKGQRREG